MPKNTASKFRVNECPRLMIATPMAYDAVVTIPIAASAPTLRVRATAVMRRAETVPHAAPVATSPVPSS